MSKGAVNLSLPIVVPSGFEPDAAAQMRDPCISLAGRVRTAPERYSAVSTLVQDSAIRKITPESTVPNRMKEVEFHAGFFPDDSHHLLFFTKQNVGMTPIGNFVKKVMQKTGQQVTIFAVDGEKLVMASTEEEEESNEQERKEETFAVCREPCDNTYSSQLTREALDEMFASDSENEFDMGTQEDHMVLPVSEMEVGMACPPSADAATLADGVVKGRQEEAAGGIHA